MGCPTLARFPPLLLGRLHRSLLDLASTINVHLHDLVQLRVDLSFEAAVLHRRIANVIRFSVPVTTQRFEVDFRFGKVGKVLSQDFELGLDLRVERREVHATSSTSPSPSSMTGIFEDMLMYCSNSGPSRNRAMFSRHTSHKCSDMNASN